jgi:hypothetical protein
MIVPGLQLFPPTTLRKQHRLAVRQPVAERVVRASEVAVEKKMPLHDLGAAISP